MKQILDNLFLFKPTQMFSDSASPIMEGISDLHNNIMFYLIMILCFVLFIFGSILRDFYKPFIRPKTLADLEFRERLLEARHLVHGTDLEIVWTILPSIILLFIAVPSFALLYSMDEVIDPSITLKVVGHQWYWSYEYSDYFVETGKHILFDSYMIPTEELAFGQFRLLEVDNQVVLPTDTHIRILVTANDVLHSFALPALGIKIDCVPGRLNQVSTFIKREGVFYGQCSELCGVNHGFMPIVVKGVDSVQFAKWLQKQLA